MGVDLDRCVLADVERSQQWLLMWDCVYVICCFAISVFVYICFSVSVHVSARILLFSCIVRDWKALIHVCSNMYSPILIAVGPSARKFIQSVMLESFLLGLIMLRWLPMAFIYSCCLQISQVLQWGTLWCPAEQDVFIFTWFRAPVGQDVCICLFDARAALVNQLLITSGQQMPIWKHHHVKRPVWINDCVYFLEYLLHNIQKTQHNEWWKAN